MRAEDFRSFVGKAYPPFTFEVEKGRLRLFAKAIGATDPVFSDEAAARRAGYRSIPAPPTFSYAITMDAGQAFNVLEDMKVPVHKSVHGAQRFTFKRPIYAGDVITGRQTVTDVYDKKNGALLFIETEISLFNQDNDEVCGLRSTVIVRQ